MTEFKPEYKKRNRKNEKDEIKSTGIDESELVLKLKKDELLDKHVLLPHAEVNSIVYEAVDRFVEKYNGNRMTLTIMSDNVSPLIQNIFDESYRSHYEDEYLKITRYLKRRYLRVVGLIFAIAISFWIAYFLTAHTQCPEVILTIISQIGVFCLWEIGYTHYDRVEASAAKSRIVRAKDAAIQFQCH